MKKVKLAWQYPADPESGSEPLQWHQAIRFGNLDDLHHSNPKTKSFAFLGYPTDEGVKRNHGRAGAAQGPEAIRKQMAKLAFHLTQTSLTDFGNVCTENLSMEEIQNQTSAMVSKLIHKGYFPILLGGGHDIAFAHFRGIANYLKTYHAEKRPGIVNLDAHLDLRKPINYGHSGTPFYEAADYCQYQKTAFRYMCLGIQEATNSPVLLKRADGLKVSTHSAYSCIHHLDIVIDSLHAFLESVDVVYLTVDLDVFASALGVSAPSPMGIDPMTGIKLLEVLKASEKVISMDVAELNPNFDIDHTTAKLAARLIYHWVT